jgi:drug/metabolite transporter (DMT)-like permease
LNEKAIATPQHHATTPELSQVQALALCLVMHVVWGTQFVASRYLTAKADPAMNSSIVLAVTKLMSRITLAFVPLAEALCFGPSRKRKAGQS